MCLVLERALSLGIIVITGKIDNCYNNIKFNITGEINFTMHI